MIIWKRGGSRVVQIKPSWLRIQSQMFLEQLKGFLALFLNLKKPFSSCRVKKGASIGGARYRKLSNYRRSLTPIVVVQSLACVLQYNEFLGKKASYLILTHVLGEIYSREPSLQVHPYIRENVWDGATLLSSFSHINFKINNLRRPLFLLSGKFNH